MEIKPKSLPSKENFIEWYNKLLQVAEIADRRYPVKGTFIWLPYGFQIMKKLKEEWDRIFQAEGIKEVYFPLFVPLKFAKQNKEWFEGFKEELFYVYNHKKKDLKLILRPTGEPAMYPIFQNWIKDGILPIRIYQTVSAYRLEGKTTHTMIRDREITFWYEIHTAHKTKAEAEAEVELHKKIIDDLWKNVLNIEPVLVEKPRYEIFPGAEAALEYYTLLPDGKLLENGSINNLGQAYARKFDLYFFENGKKKYVWQVCTGNGARYLVAVISIHGDERGLVLPPKIAPIQIIIIPIPKKDFESKILERAKEIEAKLSKHFRVKLDDSKATPGEKFNIWDLKGVPIRIEIGLEELKQNFVTVYRRDKKSKEKVETKKLVKYLKRLIEKEIPEFLLERSKKVWKEKVKWFEDYKEAKKWIEKGGVAKVNWCGSKADFEQVKSEALEFIGFLREEREGKCIICKKPTKKISLLGKVY